MSDFDRCVEKRRLVPLTVASPDVVSNEMRVAREDLEGADILLDHGQWRRATATAYYAMFHAARALVLSRGYAEKSHYCLLVAFRHFHGDSEEGRELARGIETARVLRENADYEGTASEESARDVATVAHRLVDFADRLLPQD
jgi:uncharacterized protein (UPF0332 family)